MGDPWHNHEFIAETAARNGWQWRATGNCEFLIEGSSNGLAWQCTLDQDWESVRTSAIAWVCPELVIREADFHEMLGQVTDAVRTKSTAPIPFRVPLINVYYDVPQTDIGAVLDMIRTFRRRGLKGLFEANEPELVIHDTAGVIDEAMRARLTQWPEAFGTDRKLRPVRLHRIAMEPRGFCLRSADWWASAAALTYQIQLGIDLAARLQPHFHQP
ncbi:MAG: hypothetical protein JNL98_01755 [Bryobacterales bacterium]|nr:hypothetical protein [Bryobacterales bacterium]